MFIENILSGFQSTGVFIIIISILILVHEWGHFITAKKLGVVVEKFSLGFGPKLFSKVYNGTEYLLCLIPLGGYVKMAGDERDACTGAKGEFHSKPVGQKALIVLNGPVVNYLLAYVCLVFVFALGYKDTPAKINELVKGYPAKEYGLQIGDKILEVNSKRIYGWTELRNAISLADTDTIDLTIERDGETLTKVVKPKVESTKNIFGQMNDVRSIGIRPFSSEIGMLDSKGPAKAAGLKKGDVVISVDSKEVQGWAEMQKAIENSKTEKMSITVKRGQETVTVLIDPMTVTVDVNGEEKEVHRIGIGPTHDIETYRFGIGESIVRGFNKLMEITVLTYKSFYFMITGSMSPKESITGPIGIFYFVKSAAETGLSQVLFVLGLISASLAIFNLLPVIPLDGGHLLLFALEKIRGKALPPKVEDVIMRTGFSLIMLLALFVFYVDFARFGWIDSIKQLFN